MSKLYSIQKEVEKQPLNYLENLLNQKCSLFEKIDAHSIQVERKGKSVIIWKRNGTVELSKIDRILDIRWRPLMKWILEYKDILKENLVYNIDYLPYKKVNKIEYLELPQNHIILNEFANSKISYIDEALKLNVWYNSDLWKSDSDTLKSIIIEFSKNPTENVFLELCNYFFPKANLNNIEGFILKTVDKHFKIINPSWNEIKQELPNIEYQLLINSMMNFIQEKIHTLNFEFTEKSNDRRYIEFINTIFLQWIKDSTNIINISLPSFIGEINLRECHPSIRNIITNNKLYKLHYSIMLNSFRKQKKNCWGIFNEEKKAEWNSLIIKINKKSFRNKYLKTFLDI